MKNGGCETLDRLAGLRRIPSMWRECSRVYSPSSISTPMAWTSILGLSSAISDSSTSASSRGAPALCDFKDQLRAGVSVVARIKVLQSRQGSMLSDFHSVQK